MDVVYIKIKVFYPEQPGALILAAGIEIASLRTVSSGVVWPETV